MLSNRSRSRRGHISERSPSLVELPLEELSSRPGVRVPPTYRRTEAARQLMFSPNSSRVLYSRAEHSFVDVTQISCFFHPTKQVFKQANAFLRSRDGPTPTTPENAGLTGQTGAGATEATGPERKESVLGELLGPSAVVAVGGAGGSGGAGGLPLPTVDSATVCLVGTTPSTVDLDLLDQEVRGIRMIYRTCRLSTWSKISKITWSEISNMVLGLRQVTGREMNTDTRFSFCSSPFAGINRTPPRRGGEFSELEETTFPAKTNTLALTCPFSSRRSRLA